MKDPGINPSSVQSEWPIEWPGVPSVQARAELTQLLAECVRHCRIALQNFESFTPFSLVRRHDGGVSLIGSNLLILTSGEGPISYLHGYLHQMAAHLTALCVVYAVYTQDAPVIRIYLEHVAGEAFHVWVPWHQFGDDYVRAAQPVMQATQPLIWSDSN